MQDWEYCAKQFVLPSKCVDVTKHSDQVQVLLQTERCDMNPEGNKTLVITVKSKLDKKNCKKKKKHEIHNVISP